MCTPCAVGQSLLFYLDKNCSSMSQTEKSMSQTYEPNSVVYEPKENLWTEPRIL
ncbi:hypothetical protein EV282_0605 [Fictibacillus sp. BK138]|nr:hypothetical protein EV282_0605 [Fictibacillus sp. BK138]